MPETLRAKVSSKRLRYTLKNKPRFIVRSTFNEDMKRYLRESTEWFEGFEKQLREKMAKVKSKRRNWEGWDLLYQEYKEILGEE